jgi:hypothetical protein
MKRTALVGSDWTAYVDDEAGVWRGEGAGLDVPLKMLLVHFSPERISGYADSSTYLGRRYGMLYPDAAEFLQNWGISCDIENLQPIIHEAMALPEDGAPD